MLKPLLAALLLAPGLAAAQTPSPYLVQGKIGHLSAPAKVYLVRNGQVTDSAALRDGAFELKGSTDTPRQAQLVVQRNGRLKKAMLMSANNLRLYLEPGAVLVTGPDSLPLATVAGGPLNRDFQRLQASLKDAIAGSKAAQATVQAEYLAASEDKRRSPEFAARIQELFVASQKPFYRPYAAFVQANPSSWVSLEALFTMQSLQPPAYASEGPLFEALSPELKASKGGRAYAEMLQSLKTVHTAVGDPAPAFSQRTPEGRPVALADYRGKYVLVDFWASWCGPCRQENPNVTRAYEAYKNRNFDILSVSLDDAQGRAKWLKAIADDHLAWTQVSDLHGWQNEAAVRYGVRAIPQNFLVDPQGTIVAVNLRGAELAATLARFLK